MPIIDQLDGLLKNKGAEVAAWLDARASEKPPLVYGSVDLRHSGEKIVPVDTNLFPGGFNNLSPHAVNRSATAMKQYFTRHFPDAKRVLVVPENHTRNLSYLENVACLRDIVAQAGFDVRVGSVSDEVKEPLELTTSTGRELLELPVELAGGLLQTTDGFVPDVIVMNNDMTSGVPEVMKNCAQPIIPPTGFGWYRRRKRVHFTAYDALAREFGEAFSLDHWLIAAYFRNCGMVDFRAREGFECVATNVELVLDILRVKYQEYGIKSVPFVFIKADSGTYGMGVMTARSGEEVLAMNKKYRQKMDVIKEGAQNSEVLIQEGVPTIDKVDGRTAEPMIYVVNDVAVGGAFRTHEERDGYTNLNAPGMKFYPICPGEDGKGSSVHQPAQCNFGVYGLIARLATLAAARETY